MLLCVFAVLVSVMNKVMYDLPKAYKGQWPT